MLSPLEGKLSLKGSVAKCYFLKKSNAIKPVVNTTSFPLIQSAHAESQNNKIPVKKILSKYLCNNPTCTYKEH